MKPLLLMAICANITGICFCLWGAWFIMVRGQPLLAALELLFALINLGLVVFVWRTYGRMGRATKEPRDGR